jgi:hypothetical protein
LTIWLLLVVAVVVAALLGHKLLLVAELVVLGLEHPCL